LSHAWLAARRVPCNSLVFATDNVMAASPSSPPPKTVHTTAPVVSGEASVATPVSANVTPLPIRKPPTNTDTAGQIALLKAQLEVTRGFQSDVIGTVWGALGVLAAMTLGTHCLWLVDELSDVRPRQAEFIGGTHELHGDPSHVTRRNSSTGSSPAAFAISIIRVRLPSARQLRSARRSCWCASASSRIL
jgi:hypothetical protein